MRARYAGDDLEREDDLSTDPTRPAYAAGDKSRKVNSAGTKTNKSADAGSTSLNTKGLHEDTEILEIPDYIHHLDGRISLKAKRPDTDHNWQNSSFPPPPPEVDEGWRSYRVGTLRKDAKEARGLRFGRAGWEDDYDIEYFWEKKGREIPPSEAFQIGTRKLSQAALALRRKRFQK